MLTSFPIVYTSKEPNTKDVFIRKKNPYPKHDLFTFFNEINNNFESPSPLSTQSILSWRDSKNRLVWWLKDLKFRSFLNMRMMVIAGNFKIWWVDFYLIVINTYHWGYLWFFYPFRFLKETNKNSDCFIDNNGWSYACLFLFT